MREEPAAETEAPAAPKVTVIGAGRRRPKAEAPVAKPKAELVRGDAEPDRRAAVQHVRVDHDPQRQLLQVHQLRHDIRLRIVRLQAPGSRLRAS